MTIYRGETSLITHTATDFDGTPLTEDDVVSVTIQITAPDATEALAVTAMVWKPLALRWEYRWNTDANDPVGVYQAKVVVTTIDSSESFEFYSIRVSDYVQGYAIVDDVRAFEDLEDVSDELIQEGIEWATELIDEYTGVSFAYKPFTETLDGTDTSCIRVSKLHPRSVTSVTVDGVAQTTTGWVFNSDGTITRDSGSFGFTSPGQNVVITGTAGAYEVTPTQIKWACKTLARYYVLALIGRVPDRAISINNEAGQFNLAVAGGPGRPTALPDVNAALNRYKESAPLNF